MFYFSLCMPLASTQATAAALHAGCSKPTQHRYHALNPLSISCANASTACCSSLPRAVMRRFCPLSRPRPNTFAIDFASTSLPCYRFFYLIRSVNFLAKKQTMPQAGLPYGKASSIILCKRQNNIAHRLYFVFLL